MPHPNISLGLHIELFRQLSKRTSIQERLIPYLDTLAYTFWRILCSEETISFHSSMIHEMLPLLMNLSEFTGFLLNMLNTCWNVVQLWMDSSSSTTMGIALLCQFIQFFFPETGIEKFPLDLAENERFFEFLQLGLLHEDSCTRRRASLCLQRVVSMSTQHPELERTWTR